MLTGLRATVAIAFAAFVCVATPRLMSFGDKGKLAIVLFDTNFPLAGHLVDVAAKFWLKEDASPIPIPAALPLFAGGLGLMGWMARRRRQSNSTKLYSR